MSRQAHEKLEIRSVNTFYRQILYDLRELESICIRSSYSSPVTEYGSCACLTFLPDLVVGALLPRFLNFNVSFCTGNEPLFGVDTPLVTAFGVLAFVMFRFGGLRPVFLGGFIADLATILLCGKTVASGMSSEKGSRQSFFLVLALKEVWGAICSSPLLREATEVELVEE
jgi:hypothetical protein